MECEIPAGVTDAPRSQVFAAGDTLESLQSPSGFVWFPWQDVVSSSFGHVINLSDVVKAVVLSEFAVLQLKSQEVVCGRLALMSDLQICRGW